VLDLHRHRNRLLWSLPCSWTSEICQNDNSRKGTHQWLEKIRGASVQRLLALNPGVRSRRLHTIQERRRRSAERAPRHKRRSFTGPGLMLTCLSISSCEPNTADSFTTRRRTTCRRWVALIALHIAPSLRSDSVGGSDKTCAAATDPGAVALHPPGSVARSGAAWIQVEICS
jgi:hypothetical protein